jgi:hypothetical protein
MDGWEFDKPGSVDVIWCNRVKGRYVVVVGVIESDYSGIPLEYGILVVVVW